ncbi:MAG: N-acetylmuramoyl-L-alanine amidase [Oscillospiraceae bacterium]|nr:N-acetylmuramoyl-L-alanine amidase [Oscillospiraceae bacterium]
MSFWKKMLPIYGAALVLALVCSVLTSQSVTVLTAVLATEDPPPLRTVILDPGHGGEDGGAVSVNGVLESGLNLEISLRLRDLLRFLGVPVVMTRQTDVSIYSPGAETVSEKKVSDLKNRVRLVNETTNGVLVSVHQNMFQESKYFGTQVFYAETAGSQALAEGMQELFDTKLDPCNHRQAKPSLTVYLMKNVRCPAVLVECGFLSNPEEERKLQTTDYQKKLAAVIATGLGDILPITPVS